MFVLVGFTMRYFVAGLTEGASNCDTARRPCPCRAALRAPGQPAGRHPGPGPAELAAGGRRPRPARQTRLSANVGRARAPDPLHGTAAGRLREPRRTCPTGARRWPGWPLLSGGSGSGTTTGRCRAWSEPAPFEVELGPAEGWHASWIGLGPVREDFAPPSGDGPARPGGAALRPAPYLRRRFTLAGRSPSARLYVTALGLYEARLNGARVGDAVLAPGWTDYAQRIAYQTYDVTGLLREGENVLGALLGDGWCSGFVGFDAKRAGAHYGAAPEFLAQLVIDLRRRHQPADRDRRRVARPVRRDPARRPADGRAARPARSSRTAGTRPASTPAAWRPGPRCRAVDGAPAGRRPRTAGPGHPGDRAGERHRDGPGGSIVDFGQNLPGWLRISRRTAPPGPACASGTPRCSTTTAASTRRTCARARQTDEFLTAGRRRRSWSPGSRCTGSGTPEISGYPGEPGPGDIVARVVHSDIPATGSFESSDALARPAVPQHRLGPARQLHQRADRLPAARRAARLAGRRPGLRAHRLLQPGRRRVLRQVAG